MALSPDDPGAVLSREQLLDAVTRRPDDVYDRVVDVHVANLRRKLGDDAGRRRGSSRRSRRSATGWSRRGIPRDRGVAAACRSAWRLGLILGAIVLGVLLVAGLVVNRVVSGGFETVIAGQQQQRLDDAATTSPTASTGPCAPRRSSGGSPRRSAARSGSSVRDGTTLDGVRRGARRRRRALHLADRGRDGQHAGHARGRPAGQVGDRGFLPLFNVTLLVARRAQRDRASPLASTDRRRPPDPARCGTSPTPRAGSAPARRRPGRPAATTASRRTWRCVQRDGRPPRTLRDAPAAGGERHRPRPRDARDRAGLADPGDGRRRRAGRPREPRGGALGRDRRSAAWSPSSTTSRAPRPRRSRPSRPRSISRAAIHESRRELDGLRRETRPAPRDRAVPGGTVVVSRPGPPVAGPAQRRRERDRPTARTAARVAVAVRRAAGGAARRDPGRPTRVRASRRPTSRTSSSASTAPTPRAPSTRGPAVGAGAASGSRSPASSWPRTADGSASSAPTRAARRS